MKKTGLVLGVTLLSLTLAPAAFATNKAYTKGYGGDYYEYNDDFDHDEYSDARYTRGRYDYAQVIDSHRIYDTVRRNSPQRECYDEPVRYRGGNDSYTGIITGGILGGVLGNQVGGGRGNDIATIAGAVLGGSVGRDVTRNNHGYQDYRQRCETVDHAYEERRPAGYHVTYRYKGRIYETRTDYRPGKRIRIEVPSRYHGNYDD
ncbi:MAG: glycine zipper 2TM domain-containing protein [Gammaproteobacteria bacterium]